MNINKKIIKMQNSFVNTTLLGKALIPDLQFVNADDSPLQIGQDFFGNGRCEKNPTAGPFEDLNKGTISYVFYNKL